MKKLLSIAMIALLTTGCAGISPEHKAEKEALTTLHKSEAKVTRKTIKLGLATAASVAAMDNVFESTKELKEAKQAKEVAKEELKVILEMTEK